MKAGCSYPGEPTKTKAETSPMDDVLKELVDKYLAKVPAFLRPLIKDLLAALVKKALDWLLKQSTANLPEGVQALSAGVTDDQLGAAASAVLSPYFDK